jgi:hypothetical protein
MDAQFDRQSVALFHLVKHYSPEQRDKVARFIDSFAAQLERNAAEIRRLEEERQNLLGSFYAGVSRLLRE